MGMTQRPLLATFPTPSELLSSNGSGVQGRGGGSGSGSNGQAGAGTGAVQAKVDSVDSLKTMETTQRKQRLRLLSDAVGFMPTDSYVFFSVLVASHEESVLMYCVVVLN